jgi:predicted MFS family arabinose efflux permease
MLGRRPPVRPDDPHHDAPVDLRAALTLLGRHPGLALLTLIVILAEVFGFSSITLLPVFARDVFQQGPDAYGSMVALRSLGGVLGLLLLARFGPSITHGHGLTSIVGGFGAALIVFALAPSFALAMVSLLLVGAAAASCDSISQSLMQRVASDRERGAAMGLWAFAVGFGPLGHLAVGAAAGRIGAQATQLLFAVVLVGLALVLSLHTRIRGLR